MNEKKKFFYRLFYTRNFIILNYLHFILHMPGAMYIVKCTYALHVHTDASYVNINPQLYSVLIVRNQTTITSSSGMFSTNFDNVPSRGDNFSSSLKCVHISLVAQSLCILASLLAQSANCIIIPSLCVCLRVCVCVYVHIHRVIVYLYIYICVTLFS